METRADTRSLAFVAKACWPIMPVASATDAENPAPGPLRPRGACQIVRVRRGTRLRYVSAVMPEMRLLMCVSFSSLPLTLSARLSLNACAMSRRARPGPATRRRKQARRNCDTEPQREAALPLYGAGGVRQPVWDEPRRSGRIKRTSGVPTRVGERGPRCTHPQGSAIGWDQTRMTRKTSPMQVPWLLYWPHCFVALQVTHGLVKATHGCRTVRNVGRRAPATLFLRKRGNTRPQPRQHITHPSLPHKQTPLLHRGLLIRGGACVLMPKDLHLPRLVALRVVSPAMSCLMLDM